MADSPILGIPQVAPNQNNKETTINDGFSIIERSLNQQLAVDLTAGNAVLVEDDFQHNLLFKCSGHTVARDLVVPNQVRFFAVQNVGTSVVTVKTATPVGTVDVPIGSFVFMYLDGAHAMVKIADSAASALSPTLVGLTDTPADYVGHAGKVVRVNGTEDGAEFDALSITDLSDVAAPTVLYYPRWNAAGNAIEWVPANPGGETEFLNLNDTPGTYAASAGYIVTVNATVDGLEFMSPEGFLALTQLSDVPSSYAGQAGKLLAVNGTATGMEFLPYPQFGDLVSRSVGMTNPGFEEPTFGDWFVVDGVDDDHNIMVAYGAIGAAAEGGLFYGSTSTTQTTGALQQTVDLTGIASNNELDNEAQLEIHFHYVSLNADSFGVVRVEALNAAAGIISTQETANLSTGAVAWAAGVASFTLPVGTRSVRVTLLTETTGATLEFAFDGLNPLLTVTQTNSFILLGDTPADYTGAAGQLVKVNATADGLEFGDIPEGFSGSWNDLTDKPATFAPSAHTHPAAEITDFAEAVDDRVAALFVAGTNITLTYDDVANTMTVDATGGGGDVTEAPTDGQLYARQDAGWTAFSIPSVDGAYRYWRVRLTSEVQQTTETYVRLSQIEFREEAGVPEVASGGTVLNSGWSNGAANLFDGTGSNETADEPYTGKYAGYDFGTPKVVTEVMLASSNNLAGHCPDVFVIEASNDDVAYTVILDVTAVDPPWSGFGIVERTFTLPLQTTDWSQLTGVPATFSPAAHSHTSADISDFAEALDDRVAALLVPGSNITLTYDDGANTLTIASSGGGAGGGSTVTPTFKGARVLKSATQALTNGAFTTLTWDTEDRDTNNFHDNSTNNSRLTIPAGVTKVRLIAAMATALNSTTVNLGLTFAKNGSLTFNGNTNLNTTGGSNSHRALVSDVLDVTAGDYFEVQAYVTLGGVSAQNDYRTFFALEVIEGSILDQLVSGGSGGVGAYTLPDHAPPRSAWFGTSIGSPTVTEDSGGLRYDGTNSSAQVRATFKSIPAADTVITVKIDPTTRFESNFNGGGLFLRDSASGRYLLIGIMSVGNKPWTEMCEWSSATAFLAATAGSSKKWDGAFPTWFRASYNNATKAITGSYSFDGQNWIVMGTSTYLAAPDQMGIGLGVRNATDIATIRFTYYNDGTQIGDRVVIGGASAVEEIAGTTYTQVAGDSNKFKRTTNAGAVTITINPNVNVLHDEITFCQGGAGLVTFVAGGGMTLASRGGVLASAGQHAVMGVKFISATEAVLFGDIA